MPISKIDGFEQRAAKPLHDRSFDLVLQAVGIHDRAALERDDDALDFEAQALPGLSRGLTSAAVAT